MLLVNAFPGMRAAKSIIGQHNILHLPVQDKECLYANERSHIPTAPYIYGYGDANILSKWQLFFDIIPQ